VSDTGEIVHSNPPLDKLRSSAWTWPPADSLIKTACRPIEPKASRN